jgi:hypothetical protein
VSDPYFATRSRLQLLLVAFGALAGAAVAIPLTALGKLVAGAPPATLSNYLWNMGVFGTMAAVVSPFVTWSALRRVPLWRTIVEPAVAGVAGAAIGFLLGSGSALLVLAPVGIGAAMLRLNYAYRDKGARLSPADRKSLTPKARTPDSK